MAEPKPLLIEFGICHRLERCVHCDDNEWFLKQNELVVSQPVEHLLLLLYHSPKNRRRLLGVFLDLCYPHLL